MTRKINDLRDRMIVALDVPTIWDAYRIVSQLGDTTSFYKIGYALAFAGGLQLTQQLVAEGKKVFLDLKLHDIGNTVTEGVASLSSNLGVDLLTVTPTPRPCAGRSRGATRRHSNCSRSPRSPPTTTVTCAMPATGWPCATSCACGRNSPHRTAGIDGIVCSAAETEIVRDVIGSDMLIVTPGIRPAGSAAGDQKRTLTPGEAIRAGVDHLVVGRPIIRAADPRGAAAAIMDEIAAAS